MDDASAAGSVSAGPASSRRVGPAGRAAAGPALRRRRRWRRARFRIGRDPIALDRGPPAVDGGELPHQLLRSHRRGKIVNNRTVWGLVLFFFLSRSLDE